MRSKLLDAIHLDVWDPTKMMTLENVDIMSSSLMIYLGTY